MSNFDKHVLVFSPTHIRFGPIQRLQSIRKIINFWYTFGWKWWVISFRDYLGLSDACSYDIDDVIGRADRFGFQNFCSPGGLGIRPVWSESSLSAWRKHGSLATHWVHREDSDQTGRMPRLIWVFTGRTCHFVGFVMRRLISLLPVYLILGWSVYLSGTTEHWQKAKLSTRSGWHQILLVFGIKDINSHIQILRSNILKILILSFKNRDNGILMDSREIIQLLNWLRIFFNFSVKSHGLFHQICLKWLILSQIS